MVEEGMPGTERIFSQHCRVTNGVTVKRSPMEIFEATMSQLRLMESDGSSFIAKDTPRLLWNVSFSRLSSTGNSSDGCVRTIRYLLSEGAPVIRYRSWCALQLDLNALNTWREFSDQFSFASFMDLKGLRRSPLVTPIMVNGVFHPSMGVDIGMDILGRYEEWLQKKYPTREGFEKTFMLLAHSLTAMIWSSICTDSATRLKIWMRRLYTRLSDQTDLVLPLPHVKYVLLTIETRLLYHWHSDFRPKISVTRGRMEPYSRELISYWFDTREFKREVRSPANAVSDDAAHLLVAALICTLSFPVESILPDEEPATYGHQLQHLVSFQQETTTFSAPVVDNSSPGIKGLKTRRVTWHNTKSVARIDPMKALDLYLVRAGMDRHSMNGPIRLQNGAPLTRMTFNRWLRDTIEDPVSFRGNWAKRYSRSKRKLRAEKLWKTCRIFHLYNTNIGGQHGIYSEDPDSGFHCGFSGDEIIHARACGTLRALGHTPPHLILYLLNDTGHIENWHQIMGRSVTQEDDATGIQAVCTSHGHYVTSTTTYP